MFKGRPHSGSTGTPRKGKWRRRLLRVVLGLVALLFLGCAFLFYGWRYGFRPLPEPLTGPEAARPVLPTLAEVGPGNYWYWPQALQKQIPTNAFEAEILIRTVQEWCRYGWVDQTNRVLLREWIKRTPELPECCQGATRATNGLARLPWMRGQAPVWHERLLRAYAVWLALEPEQEGRIPEAMDRLVEAWRLEARSASLNLGYEGRRPLRIDQAWRRLMLSAPTLESEQLKIWQERLRAVERGLPSLADTYETLAEDRIAAFAASESAFVQGEVNYEDAGEALREILSDMLHGGLENLEGAFSRFLGRQPSSPPESVNLRPLADFVEGLARMLAWRCSRSKDRLQVLEAAHTRRLRTLRQANAVEALRASELWKTRWWDRPAAWSMCDFLDSGAWLIPRRRQCLAPLRSCQLVLALRMFRDQTGSWPASQADCLPFPPLRGALDPLDGVALAYQADGHDWEAALTITEDPGGWPANGAIPYAFHSRENEATFFRFAYGLLSNGVHRTNDWLLPALKRYGIAQSVESVTNAAPVITNLIFQIQEHRALGLAPESRPSYSLRGWGLPGPKQVPPILQTMRAPPSSLTNLALPVSSRFPSHEYDDRYLLHRKASPPPPPL